MMAGTKEKLGIVGPNGAGKSTLLKTIVAGLGGVRMCQERIPETPWRVESGGL